MKILNDSDVKDVVGGDLFSDVGHAIGYAVGWAAHRIADVEDSPYIQYHSAG